MKKFKNQIRRSLSLAVALSMCLGTLHVTAFAEDGTVITTTTEGPTTTGTDSSEDSGSNSTATTTTVTTVTTQSETSDPEKNSVTTTGDSKVTGTTTESTVTKDESKTDVEDLSFEANGTIKLEGGSGKGTVHKEVTAEGIAKDLGWTCKDSENSETGENGETITTKTEVKNEDGVYIVESTKTTEVKTEGEKTESGREDISKTTTTSDPDEELGTPTETTTGGEEEIKLPERPVEGTTTNEDGTSTVVSVQDVADENGVTTGYTVTTEVRDADGNVISTRTENISGTTKTETTETVKVDEVTNSTTTETKTKVEEVQEDKVITTTETVRNEVSVCEDKNKLSANVAIDITDFSEDRPNEGTNVVLGKNDVISADVALKQTTTGANNETKVTVDVAFTVKIQQGADPSKLEVTVFNKNNPKDKIGMGTVKVDEDGKTRIVFSNADLTDYGENGTIVFDISYSDYSAEGEKNNFYAGLQIDMTVSDIQTIGAAAKHTEATKETEDVTTTTFEREDTTVETETTTTVTTTTTKQEKTTDTVNRSWNTTRPEPVEPENPGTTTPGTTTPGGGTGTTGTVTVADGPVPMAEAPEVEVPETEVPLAETPVEMEIPEEAVPLADSTEVVIADDAVPLADVPKTGDISNLWYAAALLSACGLAALNGKKREEEDA